MFVCVCVWLFVSFAETTETQDNRTPGTKRRREGTLKKNRNYNHNHNNIRDGGDESDKEDMLPPPFKRARYENMKEKDHVNDSGSGSDSDVIIIETMTQITQKKGTKDKKIKTRPKQEKNVWSSHTTSTSAKKKKAKARRKRAINKGIRARFPGMTDGQIRALKQRERVNKNRRSAQRSRVRRRLKKGVLEKGFAFVTQSLRHIEETVTYISSHTN